MSDTPETNAAEDRCIATGFKTGYVDVEFALRLERERNEAKESLAFIAEWGGKTHETECGDIRCDGDWCAEQARSAIYLLKENQ